LEFLVSAQGVLIRLLDVLLSIFSFLGRGGQSTF
jgi:hypothetical protein